MIPASRTPIARVGIAIAIRAGAPKPDIRTTEALKQTLLKAKSISYGVEGASGAYFAALIQKLGIADTLKPKFQLKTSGEAVAQAVANGEAELGVAPATEIIPVKGAEVLGTFPDRDSGLCRANWRHRRQRTKPRARKSAADVYHRSCSRCNCQEDGNGTEIESLDDHRDPLADADAHRRQAVARVAAMQRVHQRGEHPRAATSRARGPGRWRRRRR